MPIATSYYRDIWSCGVQDVLSGWEMSFMLSSQVMQSIVNVLQRSTAIVGWISKSFLSGVGLEDVWYHLVYPPPSLILVLWWNNFLVRSFHVPLYASFWFQWKTLSNHGAKKYSGPRVDDVMAFLFLHFDLREPPSTFPCMLGFDMAFVYLTRFHLGWAK